MDFARSNALFRISSKYMMFSYYLSCWSRQTFLQMYQKFVVKVSFRDQGKLLKVLNGKMAIKVSQMLWWFTTTATPNIFLWGNALVFGDRRDFLQDTEYVPLGTKYILWGSNHVFWDTNNILWDTKTDVPLDTRNVLCDMINTLGSKVVFGNTNEVHQEKTAILKKGCCDDCLVKKITVMNTVMMHL